MTTRSWWRDQGDLDDEQKEVIKLDIDGRHLLLGPPGSGKTNILALRGTYLTKLGRPNILLITFTRTLKEFIGAGTQDRYGLPEGAVQTFQSWAYKFLHRAGVPHDVLRDDTEQFTAKRQRYLQLFDEMLKSGAYAANHYDAILIDEVQDFLAAEVQTLSRLSRTIFAAGDIRQRIYQHNEGIAAAQAAGCRTINLTKHYRNGRNICAVADRILPSPDGVRLIDTCQYREADDPSRAELIRCDDFATQFANMAKFLREQLRLYREEYIGILCPNRDVRDRIWELIQASDLAPHAMLQRHSDGYNAFSYDQPICVMTSHAAKGLEFKAVHIPQANFFRDDRNLAFTTVTRAKTALTAYHTTALPGWFQGAFTAPIEKEPELEDLF